MKLYKRPVVYLGNPSENLLNSIEFHWKPVAYERLTQSLTQASYAKSYTSVLREDLDFFYLLKPYASLTQDPYADAV